MAELPSPGSRAAARAAVLLSGAGSNAEALIRFSLREEAHFRVALLVTDAPETSRAKELAEEYSLPLVSLDLKAFYRAHGEQSTRLDSPRRQQLRRAWSEELWKKMAPWPVDFALLAGFVPLTQLTEKLPCLNVHPGDLTWEEEGKRVLAGLHYLPVERAILRGREALKSSVILAQPFSGSGSAELDSGPVLGISRPVPVDLEGHTREELAALSAARGKGPHRDALRTLAEHHIARLKEQGDHVIFPLAADDFAAGRFAYREGRLYYDGIAVRTVEYSADGSSSPVLL